MLLERKEHLARLIDESFAIADQAAEDFIYAEGKTLTATCVLYSGGNDSTTLAHLFRHRAQAAIHVNTGIGIEATRQFVRDTCASWDLPLMEMHPPAGSTYRELVLDQGFPGPAHHYKMYQRLKERGLRQARNALISRPRAERVLFLAGRRRDESSRRMLIPEMERVGSTVWASPLANWTKADLNTYRELHDVPRNPVSDALHMSGECLCGAFAHIGELEEIEFWYPDVAVQIRSLEDEVRAAGHPEERCKWGWGAERGMTPEQIAEAKSGALCSTCDSRFAAARAG